MFRDAETARRAPGSIVLPLSFAADEPMPLTWSGRAHRGAVDLVLPAALMLAREVEMPRAALARRARVAELDLSRRTPFKPREALWCLGQPRVEGDTARVTQ